MELGSGAAGNSAQQRGLYRHSTHAHHIEARELDVNKITFEDGTTLTTATTTQEDLLPWAGLSNTSFLQTASLDTLLTQTTPPTVADFASWDRQRLEKNLFIHATGKWFGEAQRIQIYWESDATLTSTWSPSTTQMKLGQMATFDANITRQYGRARARTVEGVDLDVGGPMLSTSDVATTLGGSNPNWWQQLNARYSGSAITLSTVSSSGNNGSTFSTTYSSTAQNRVAQHEMHASTTLGDTVSSTPVVQGTITFTPVDTTVFPDLTDNLGGGPPTHGLARPTANLDLSFPTFGSVSVTNYIPWWKSTDNGVNWQEQDSSASGRITSTSLNAKAVDITIPQSQRTTTKFWIPAPGVDAWNAMATISSNAVSGVTGQLSAAVYQAGQWGMYALPTSKRVADQSAPVAPYSTYSITGVVVGPFDASSTEALVLNIGWGNYTTG